MAKKDKIEKNIYKFAFFAEKRTKTNVSKL